MRRVPLSRPILFTLIFLLGLVGGAIAIMAYSHWHIVNGINRSLNIHWAVATIPNQPCHAAVRLLPVTLLDRYQTWHNNIV